MMKDNKLIAEFMRAEDGTIKTPLGLAYVGKENSFNEAQYHTSWDWLMPVVEKIRKVTSYDRDKFSTEVIIYGNKTTIKSGGYGEKRHSNLFFNKTELGTWNTIEPTYQAVVEFIKWYNETK